MTRYASSYNYGNFMSTYGEDDKQKGNLGGNPNSHIPAHESLAVAAPFRA